MSWIDDQMALAVNDIHQSLRELSTSTDEECLVVRNKVHYQLSLACDMVREARPPAGSDTTPLLAEPWVAFRDLVDDEFGDER